MVWGDSTLITYHEEKLIDIIDEMKPLVELHYEEVHAYKGKVALNPDWDRYKFLDSINLMHTTTIRDDGVLVGYCVFMVAPNLHYKDHVYAINDVLYVSTELRHTTAAGTLLSFAEKCLQDIGVSVVTMHMKTHVPFDGLMTKLGYKKVEYVYGKYIGE